MDCWSDLVEGVDDDKITASSNGEKPGIGRLETGDAWVANTNTPNEYIQVYALVRGGIAYYTGFYMQK